MLFSEAVNHPVLSTDTAKTVGTVSGFLVDPASAKVVALRLRRSAGAGDVLGWQDLTAFGPDAVTVPSAAALASARGRAVQHGQKGFAIVGKRVLTDAGTEIGTVRDVDFDPSSGTIQGLVTATHTVCGDRLVGCGSYAVIVTDA